MAPKSRIRPRGPVHPPTSEIVVTHKHSYELVRTVLTATFSHILWVRRVFPHVEYLLRSCDPADPEVSYDAFMAGSSGKPTSFDPTDGLHVWKVMPRFKEPAVDKLLDCLEIGAADALKRGYLSKLQLSFHSMNEAPAGESNMIESYTMFFTYENGQDISISTEIESSSVVLRSAKQHLYNLVNDVGFLIHHTNQHRLEHKKLPDKFRMIMSLKYHEHTPPDYQPPLFRQGNENTLQILGLGTPDDKLVMDTGVHRISFGVNILGIEDPTSLNHSRLYVLSQRQRTLSASSDFEGEQTQPEALRQIQTIGIFRDPDSGTQDTMPLRKTQISQVIETQNGLEGLGVIEYTQQVLDRISTAKTLALQNDLDLDEQQSTQPETSCECCASGNEESLTQCAICREFKHTVCYGYAHNHSPQVLVCYTCLLSNDDPDRLEMIMKPLCLKRRALYYLREKGSLSARAQDEDFAVHLNVVPKIAARLLSELKTDGYIKGHKRGKKTSPAPVYTYIGDDEILHQNYFRPQQGIDHYFTIPEPHILGFSESGFEDNLTLNHRQSFVGASPDLYGASPVLSRTITGEAVKNTLNPPSTPLFRSTINALQSSSTLGTPSPQQIKPLSHTRKLAAMESNAAEQPSPTKQYGTFIGTKRIVSGDEIEASFKRHKVGEVSPWIIHRRET